MTSAGEIQDFDSGDLRSEASALPGSLQVRLTGSADSPARAPLDALFAQVHAEALRRGVREVVVDIRALEFMNSSCLKTFVTWLSNLQECDPSQQYSIRFLSNPALHWQGRSLSALSCFAVSLIRVETQVETKVET